MSAGTVSREMYDALESGIEIATREYESTIKGLESKLAEANDLTHRLAKEGLENREVVEFLDRWALSVDLYGFPRDIETVEAINLTACRFTDQIHEEMERFAEVLQEETEATQFRADRDFAEAAEEDRSLMGAERL